MPDPRPTISSTTARDLIAAWDRHVMRRARRRLSGRAANLLRRCYTAHVEGQTAAGWPASRAAIARARLEAMAAALNDGRRDPAFAEMVDAVTWDAGSRTRVGAAGADLIAYLAHREARTPDLAPSVDADGDDNEPPF